MTRFTVIAAAALMAAAPAFAQNATGIAKPGMPAQPPVLAEMGVTDVTVHTKKLEDFGVEMRGNLPGGGKVEVDVRPDGSVEEIDADNGSFPESAIRSLIPQAVLDNASWPKGANLTALDLNGGRKVEIEGRDASGRKFDAEFTPDGKLIELDYD